MPHGARVTRRLPGRSRRFDSGCARVTWEEEIPSISGPSERGLTQVKFFLAPG